MTPSTLSQRITDFVAARTEAIVARFLPDFVVPGFFCGHRRAAFSEGPNLVFMLAHLHRLGVPKMAGVPIDEAIVKLLRGVHGPATETFYSFFVAESLLAFGTFENNPLLADFTDAERENIKTATDTTHIYDSETKWLRGSPNNYWAVLARCEFARKRLGILQDETLLEWSVEQLQKLLFRNPLGFFDDGAEGNGRYDIYSADVQLFCEPMWHLFGAAKMESNLRRHVWLLEKIAMENGASFVFGRSTGALSVCLTMELASMSLERGLAADPARSLQLIAHAFDAFKTWFEDDLINAHRHGNTESYRGIYRVLQMSLDCLAKLCYAAEKLRAASVEKAPPSLLYPDIDELIPFDGRNAGVWMFRNAHLAFQLALIDGVHADYVPWPRSPGLLENPVGSPMLCGVPRIAKGALEFTAGGLPARVEKTGDGMTTSYENFQCASGERDAEPFRGRRVVNYRVEADTIIIEENLFFEELPDAVSFFVPEATRPLDVEFKSAQPFHHDTIAVSGMAEWRSAWGGLKTLHQAHFEPAREIHFSCTITPKLRASMVPAHDHDYTRALLENIASRYFSEMPPRLWNARTEDVPGLTRELDIFHVGWPEHLLANPGLDEAEFDRRMLEFVDALGQSDTRIVWTMHNRRPHWWPPERGRQLYRTWASIADGVIHHSEWAMKIALAELPYKTDAKHVIIPHGNYRDQRRTTRARAEIEAGLGLPACKMRFGVLGRWQPEKRVETIMRAFEKGARADQQLVVSAYDEKTPRPDDPRIIFLPRRAWMSREDVAAHTHLCDALVSAHLGDSYFTSGISADAVGVGIPMLAPHWEFFHETLGDAAFYHDNSEESLAGLFRSITFAEIENKKVGVLALQPKTEWPRVAERTLALYRSLGRKRK